MATDNIFQKLNQDLQSAIKQRNTEVVRVLRFCKSQLDSAAKDAKQDQLSDAEAIKVISKKIKQSKDSAEAFKKGKRDDLAEAEEQEIKILSQYLPEQLSEAELGAIVEKVIAATGAKSVKDFGKVMGAVMKEVAGQADGVSVKRAVEQKLSS